MEQLLIQRPLMNESVQPLRPLTSEIFDNGFNNLSFYVDKTTSDETALHSLDPFNELSNPFIETVSFDWFSNEKSFDVSMLKDAQPSLQEEIRTSNNVPINSFLIESPVYEYKIPSNLMINDLTTEITQPMTPVSFYDNISMSVSPSGSLSSIKSDILSHHTVLASPENSEDKDLMKLLEEMEPDDWNTLLSQPESFVSNIISENTFSMDRFSDVLISSPSHGSESESDCFILTLSRTSENGSEDSDFIPLSRVEKLSKKSKSSEKERKLRKKEQNKMASTRYRMKKKQELELYLIEEHKLLDKNKELCTQLDELARELKCLKSLMRDVYRKKGLLK